MRTLKLTEPKPGKMFSAMESGEERGKKNDSHCKDIAFSVVKGDGSERKILTTQKRCNDVN